MLGLKVILIVFKATQLQNLLLHLGDICIQNFHRHYAIAPGLDRIYESYIRSKPGAIARLVGMSLGNQEAPRLILTSGTSFREDLVMKLFLWPFFLFR